MNELPTEKRCKDVILTHRIDKIPIYFTDSEAQSAREWAIVRGIDTRHMNHADLASRILSEHYGAASTLPERDEATGTGPATADRPADVWRESAGTIEQRDGKPELRPGERWATTEEQKAYEKHMAESTGKPEPKLATTAEERWAKQMARCEAMIEKQERMQEREEKLLIMAERLVAMAIARLSPPPTAEEIERTHELAKERGWEKCEATIGTVKAGSGTPTTEAAGHSSFPNIKRGQGLKLDGYTAEQEIQDLRAIVEDQNAIIKEYEKRLEAGRKRGQMVRDLLSQEV